MKSIHSIIEENMVDDTEDTSGYAIETGIPLPKPSRDAVRQRSNKYPTMALEVGQSFFVPLGNVPPTVLMRRVTASVQQSAKRHAKAGNERRSFSLRRVEEGGTVTGVRVWRVK